MGIPHITCMHADDMYDVPTHPHSNSTLLVYGIMAWYTYSMLLGMVMYRGVEHTHHVWYGMPTACNRMMVRMCVPLVLRMYGIPCAHTPW